MKNYPFSPPKIKFLTKIWHSNIDENGNICLSILKDNYGWTPALTINKVLISICSLLSDPCHEDPLNADAAALYRESPDKYNALAIEWTIKYAMNN